MKTLQKLADLSGRRAILTGGAGHIGLAVGETLVEMGANVSIIDLTLDACQDRVETLSQIRKHEGVAIPCDLGDEQATREAIRQGNYGRLGVVGHLGVSGLLLRGGHLSPANSKRDGRRLPVTSGCPERTEER